MILKYYTYRKWGNQFVPNLELLCMDQNLFYNLIFYVCSQLWEFRMMTHLQFRETLVSKLLYVFSAVYLGGGGGGGYYGPNKDLVLGLCIVV